MIWKIILIVVFVVGVMAESFIDKMCRLNGAEDKITEVQDKYMASIHCINDIFTIDNVIWEMQEGVRNGTVKTVLEKYCHKTTPLKACFHQYFEAIAPCQVQLYPNISVNYASIDGIIDFICSNGGEHFASFAADGGALCAIAKVVVAQDCVSNTLNTVSRVAIRNSHEESCRVLAETHTCLISTVESCPTPSAANFFRHIVAIVRSAHNCTQ